MSSVFDSNAWYTIASIASNGTRSIHWCSQSIVCNSDSLITGVNASWQILTHNSQPDSAATFTLRNKGLGPEFALAVSLGTYEGQPETQPGLLAAEDGDPTQLWDLVRKGQVSGQDIWFIQNIANGTNFNLAEHGEGLYIGPGAQEPGLLSGNQTWLITQVGEINNVTWSPTSASGPSPSPSNNITITNSNTNQHGSGHHMSAGAIAGIVIGAILGFLLLLIGAMFLIRQRLRSKRSNPSHPPSELGITRELTWDVSPASRQSQEKGVAGTAFEMPTHQSEKSFSRVELPQPLHLVIPGRHVPELDATL